MHYDILLGEGITSILDLIRVDLGNKLRKRYESFLNYRIDVNLEISVWIWPSGREFWRMDTNIVWTVSGTNIVTL